MINYERAQCKASSDHKHLILIDDRGRRREFRSLNRQEFTFLCHVLTKMYADKLEYAGHDAQEWRVRVN